MPALDLRVPCVGQVGAAERRGAPLRQLHLDLRRVVELDHLARVNGRGAACSALHLGVKLVAVREQVCMAVLQPALAFELLRRTWQGTETNTMWRSRGCG